MQRVMGKIGALHKRWMLKQVQHDDINTFVVRYAL